MKDKIRVQRERNYYPHHVLISAASTALEDARQERTGYFNYELMCITFCALALEAMGNAFGEKFIQRWSDFESATPVAKLRLVCEHSKITLDFESEPWSAVLWLVKFRNGVAHAKPMLLKEDHTVPRDDYNKVLFEQPQSKLEGQVTLQNAERAFNCVTNILETFCTKIPLGKMGNLLADGWIGGASPAEPT
jgi:hypothetical protein